LSTSNTYRNRATFHSSLPSLWISLHEILRSGLSDVWAAYVASHLFILTPYLWPCEDRRP